MTVNECSFVVVADFFWEGHVPDYHKLFIRKFLEQDHQVLTVSPANDDVEHWTGSLKGQYKKRVTAVSISRNDIYDRQSLGATARTFQALLKFSLLLKEWRFPKSGWLHKALFTVGLWIYLNSIIKTQVNIHHRTPELVLIGYMDSHFMVPGITGHMIDKVFDYPWAGLYLSPSDFRESVPPRRKNLLERHFPAYDIFKSKKLVTVLISDEGALDAIRRYIKKSVVYLPETASSSLPTNQSNLAREIFKQARGRKIVSLLGVLAERKGIKMLVEAANRLVGENIFFLFAGKLHEGNNTYQIASLLSKLPNNCYTHLQTIDGEEFFNELIALSDVIFLGYRQFYHGSGILTKAAVFRKPVIASRGHCIGERVEQFELGITIDEDNVEECIAAIHRLLNNDPTEFSVLSPKYDDYLNIHSGETIKHSFDQLMQLRSDWQN